MEITGEKMFEKGMRVVVVKCFEKGPPPGERGTIVGLVNYRSKPAVLIEFDNRFERGHNGYDSGPKGKDGHCWIVSQEGNYISQDKLEADEEGNYW